MAEFYKCRICFGQEMLTSIFSTRGLSTISMEIMSLANVHISPDDGLPNTICSKCLQKLDLCLDFIQLCEHSDMKLRALLQKEINKTESLFDHDEFTFSQEDSKYSPKSEQELLIDENIGVFNGSISETEPSDTFNKTKSKKMKDKTIQKQQCSTCGKVMSSRFRLKTHLRTHTGERPYSCSNCGKNFSLAQNLKVHMRVHTGEKPHHCTICGKSFAQSAGLAAHRRKHSGQTPYSCKLCPRSFRTIGHLHYHVRRHTGEKNFECDTCGRAFITRSDLKQHLMTHTGARPYVCPTCGVRLTRSSHLKRHILHAHSTLYKCSHCPKTFMEKIDYESHQKAHENHEPEIT